MMAFPDPVGEGMVGSLAQPGSNVTGLTGLNPELNTKRLEILKDVIPKLTRVGLLRQAEGGGVLTKELRAAAVALKLNLTEIETEVDKRIRSCFSNRKEEAGQRDFDRWPAPLFRRKKADRRACGQIPLTRYLLGKEVCRCRRSDVLWRGYWRPLSASGGLRRQDLERCQTG
jgi:ABC transporter substrate binding protein